METRTQTISRHVERFKRDTGASDPTFAQAVVEQYHQRVAPEHRRIQFKTEGDAFTCMKLNAQTLTRVLDGDLRLPADLEESVVFALPEERMEACRADLARRYGLLAVPLLKGESLAERAQFAGRLARDSGKALQDLGDLMKDEGATPEHIKLLESALADMDELSAMATAVRGWLMEHISTAQGKGSVRRLG